MSFDAGAHLKKQGWKGKGEAFKQGHLSRPLAVKLKNNLGGVGKDRIEDFPFWDHVFAAAASSIIIPSPSSSGSSSSDSGSPPPEDATLGVPKTIHRTSTGIISPYAPTHHSSKLATIPPADASSESSALNLNHFAYAKRVLAKRELYERFYKGRTIATTIEKDNPPVPVVAVPKENRAQHETSIPTSSAPVLLPSTSTASKKRKSSEDDDDKAESKRLKKAKKGEKALKKEAKRLKKEAKEEKKAKKEAKREKKEKKNHAVPVVAS